MPFEQLGLEAGLLRAVKAQGYTQPTPIQTQAVPVVLAGHDVLGRAQTGTGKTAAFTLPMLQLLGSRQSKSRAPRALVLTPTRELAAQVNESVETYGAHMRLRSTVIFGGVSINPQKSALRRGVDIVVATPGRLLDHAGQGTIDLSEIEILVLDEADRMLDMGFIHDIRKVLKLLPKRRQNLLFSATISDEVKRLADSFLYQPRSIEVERRATAAETVTQHAYRVEKQRKRDLLIHLIASGDWSRVLVFTRTKHGANRLAQQLVRAGIEAAAIHGNKSQTARTRALAQFKQAQVRVLVATDIAARGLDIDRLPHVVNYELPNVAEDYVHRIGRTGRAGEEGAAISLVGSDEAKYLRDIERLLNKEIPVLPVPHFEPSTLAELPERSRQTEFRPHGQRKASAKKKPRPVGNSRRGQSRSGSNAQSGSGPAPAGQRRRRPRSGARRKVG